MKGLQYTQSFTILDGLRVRQTVSDQRIDDTQRRTHTLDFVKMSLNTPGSFVCLVVLIFQREILFTMVMYFYDPYGKRVPEPTKPYWNRDSLLFKTLNKVRLKVLSLYTFHDSRKLYISCFATEWIWDYHPRGIFNNIDFPQSSFFFRTFLDLPLDNRFSNNPLIP